MKSFPNDFDTAESALGEWLTKSKHMRSIIQLNSYLLAYLTQEHFVSILQSVCDFVIAEHEYLNADLNSSALISLFFLLLQWLLTSSMESVHIDVVYIATEYYANKPTPFFPFL